MLPIEWDLLYLHCCSLELEHFQQQSYTKPIKTHPRVMSALCHIIHRPPLHSPTFRNHHSPWRVWRKLRKKEEHKERRDPEIKKYADGMAPATPTQSPPLPP